MSLSCLLIANRGEIALRVMRSARDMGIRCVALYMPADADAPFVTAADEAVLIGDYMDADAIVTAAAVTEADAIHPGYGFLSEHAGFARAVTEAGLTWVGPSPRVIESMGDKLAAKALARRVGVPTLPESDNPDDAEEIGFPLLVKAAAGGGGKGMRIVASATELEESIAAARREAAAGFGDDRVFLERYLPRCRHIEIQILGDRHGNLVHLGERECSIQRRYQKILEESPSPRLDAELRETMGEAALQLARELGYESAGTVEFVLDDANGAFYFLEVNTRLQVEHPVTEAVTGIDLVREQLRIADGEPLGYQQGDISYRGHAIEARLYAENPAAGFLPATGTLFAFEPAAEPAVRLDSGVVCGTEIGTSFDPMLAKVIASAPTRRLAAGRLALALERLHIGGVVTNRDFLVATLRTPEFLAGDTTTDFIERVAPARTLELSEQALQRAMRTAALWIQGNHRQRAAQLAQSPSGWRNSLFPDQWIAFQRDEQQTRISYHALRGGDFVFDDGVRAHIHDWSPRCLDVEIDGRRTRSSITLAGDQILVQVVGGTVELQIRPRFELPGQTQTVGGLNAPMPGKVIDLRVAVGDSVQTGDILVILEAMKMEHPITAREDGVVTEVFVSIGEQVNNGAPLLSVVAEAMPEA